VATTESARDARTSGNRNQYRGVSLGRMTIGRRAAAAFPDVSGRVNSHMKKLQTGMRGDSSDSSAGCQRVQGWQYLAWKVRDYLNPRAGTHGLSARPQDSLAAAPHENATRVLFYRPKRNVAGRNAAPVSALRGAHRSCRK
jgi:hypothetical protein